jgi:hypothetical protein
MSQFQNTGWFSILSCATVFVDGSGGTPLMEGVRPSSIVAVSRHTAKTGLGLTARIAAWA